MATRRKNTLERQDSEIARAINQSVMSHQNLILFEGSVTEKCGDSEYCIVSFPGKEQEGWNELVRKGKFAQRSVACVFLPEHTPKSGQHSDNPACCGKKRVLLLLLLLGCIL